MIKRLLDRGRYAFIAILMLATCFIGNLGKVSAQAESTNVSYAQSSVMDDLQGMTINGEPFDIADYAYDETRDVQVLTIAECGYSYKSDKQSEYGLYVYVWNPKGLSFEEDVVRNRLEMRYGDDMVPGKYPLTIMSKCEEQGKENLFYKMRVELTDEERTAMLYGLNSVARRYDVSGIELLQTGQTTATEYSVATVFTYSGFAAGYGPDGQTESTLSCTRDTSEVLELQVHPTYYRPNGSNGENSYTQDTLMSVYFSVPNEMLGKYDRLTGLECTWVKLFTDWIFVTGNQTIYNAILPFIAENALFGEFKDDNNTPYISTDDKALEYGFVGKSIEGENIVSMNTPFYEPKEVISRLDYMFYVDGGIDAADQYILETQVLEAWMRNYYADYALPADKDARYISVDGYGYPPYAAELFSVARGTTTQVLISADDEFSLTEQKISQNWWQALWNSGADLEYSKTFDGIEAIHQVTAEEMQKTSDKICKELYISPQDVGAFQSFYTVETLKNRTVFLLRYDIGKYEALEVHQGKVDDSGFVIGLTDTDTNARVFRQDVYLNFDIIYAEFESSGEKVIMPVVSSPIDIIPDSTPPLHTTSDKQWTLEDILMLVLGLTGLLIIIILFAPLLPKAFKGLVWLIALPFKGLKALFKKKKKDDYDDDDDDFDWDDWDGWEDFFDEDF